MRIDVSKAVKLLSKFRIEITKRGKAVPFIDCNEAAKWAAAAEAAGGRNNWRTSGKSKKAAGRGQSTGQWSSQRETERENRSGGNERHKGGREN